MRVISPPPPFRLTLNFESSVVAPPAPIGEGVDAAEEGNGLVRDCRVRGFPYVRVGCFCFLFPPQP